MRKSFVFYESFYDAINDVDEKTQLQLYKAICELSIKGIKPKLTGLAATLFKLIAPQLEANTKKFEDGQKGGRPKKQTRAEDILQEKTTGYENKKTTGFKKEKPNVNENDNVNDNVNENENVKGDCKGENKLSSHTHNKNNANCLDNTISPRDELEVLKNTQKAKKTHSKKEKEQKHAYESAKNVLLTDKQHTKLQQDYGSDLLEMVEYLSDYIAKKGGEIEKQDHNRVLRGWVKNAVRERKLKQQELELREKELEARRKRLEEGYPYPKSGANQGMKTDIEDKSTNPNDWI